MKHYLQTIKGFLFIISLSVFSISISSCTNVETDEPKTGTNETDFQKLSMELDDYVQQFESEHPTSPQSRSFFKRLWHAIKADVFVSCRKELNEWQTTTGISIGASNAVWKKYGTNDIDYSSLPPQAKAELEVMLNNAKNNMDLSGSNIGYIHNAALLTLITSQDGGGSTTSEIASNTVKALSTLGIDTSKIDQALIKTEIDTFMNYIYDNDDEVLCQRFVKVYPETKNEIAIIKKYCSTALKLQENNDIETFTNGYCEIIKKSNIDDASKITLQRTLSVAPASTELWNKIETIN